MTTVPRLRALDCPQCGGPITPRTFGHAINVVCDQCGSVLDARDPRLQVLQAHARKTQNVVPLIPLGTRGTWRGHPYEVVGLQQRTITVEGTRYSWREYLLFNPYRGFRYLTEYDGHWNDVVPLRGVPARELGVTSPSVQVAGMSFRRFQTAEALTTYVLGEFPWQVRTGDSAYATDYVAPPQILSSERTDDEETWSIGEYVEGREIWKAFGLPGRPPRSRGVYANQPSPMGRRIGPMWRTFALLVVLVMGTCVWRQGTARRDLVFQEQYSFRERPGDDSAFVTDVFELKGRPASVQVEADASVDNDWLFLEYALIDEATGRAWEMGRTVSYYHGVDQGERWSEGGRRDRARIPAVPPGRYYLRVRPEGEPGRRRPIDYTLRVRRDVPSVLLPALALLALLVPPAFVTVRHLSFEHRRWMESDNPPMASRIVSEMSED